MELYTTHYHGQTIISVLRLVGKLDAVSYLDLIDKARSIVGEGTRQIVLDLSALTYISSAGLMALHYITVLLRGGAPLDPETGWSALHAVAEDLGEPAQHNVNLLNPQPHVLRTLERVRFTAFLSSYTTLDDAISAFAPSPDRRSQTNRPLRYLRALNAPDLKPKPDEPA